MKTSHSLKLFGTAALALLLLSSALSLSSCEKEKETAAADGDVPEQTAQEDDSPKLEVPDGICEGKTFTVYFGNPDVTYSYLVAEETGDLIGDSVYRRNVLTQEKTGVEFDFAVGSHTSSGSDQAAETSIIRTLIQSGDDTYDVYMHVQHSGMPTLIEEGMFVDWNTVPYVNLENPWWYSNVVRDICFGDKVFCMTGDYNLPSFALTECLIFNKTMCDELGLEYPYGMVTDGTWTHDRFLEYIKKGSKDLNGDGVLDIESDRYGFGGWKYEQLKALFCAYGGECIRRSEWGLPELCIDREITYTVIDKMLEIFSGDWAFFEGKTWGVNGNMFREGRLLFDDGFLGSIPGTRDLEDIDVGFVPYPKLNEEQEAYYSRTANISGLTYIPVTNTDLEKTGAVLETMAYYSSLEILPNYFDIILTVKSTRDVESEEMIPIIKNSSRFLDQVIGFTGNEIVEAGNGNTLASFIASKEDYWEDKVYDLIDVYFD